MFRCASAWLARRGRVALAETFAPVPEGRPLAKWTAARSSWPQGGAGCGGGSGPAWASARQKAAKTADLGAVVCAASAGIAFFLATPVILGRVLEGFVEIFDKALIGVDVDMSHLRIYPWSGKLVVHDFKVVNPPGFTKPNFMRAGKIVFDVDMLKLLRSFGKDVDCERIKFQDVQFTLEKHGSKEDEYNLTAIQELVSGNKEDEKPEPAEPEAKAPSKSKTKFTLRALRIEQASIVNVGDWGEQTVEIADIVYDDFSKEVGDSPVDDVMKILMGSIVKTVVAAVQEQFSIKTLKSAISTLF